MTTLNVNTIKKFIEELFVDRRITLYRINTKLKKPNVVGTGFDSIDQAIDWIKKYNKDGNNIYYPYNIPKKNITKKPDKKSLMWITGFHVDIDMPAGIKEDDRDGWIESQREKIGTLLHTSASPHIIATGNGVQVLYEFQEVLKATDKNIEQVEYVNRQLAFVLGGDSCHNIDRILRVPGTVNWPNAKKKEMGYKSRNSDFLQASDGYFYFEDFADLPEPPAKKLNSANIKRIDYTLLDYPEHYTPVTYQEMVNANPPLDTFELSGDNSADAMTFITHCIKALVMIRKCDAHELPVEVKKNLAHVVIESEEEFLPHYDTNGMGKLGFDIDRALIWASDEIFYTPRLKRQRKRNDVVEKAASVEDMDDLTQSERVVCILENFRGRCRLEDLPNTDTTSSGSLKPTAPVTLPNVQEALKLMDVVPRWDDMRDHVSFVFNDEEVQNHINALTKTSNPSHQAELAYGYVTAFLIELGLRSDTALRTHIETVSRDNRFHPWSEYISEVKWDGKDRFGAVADTITSEHPMKLKFITTMFLSLAAVSASHASYVFNETGQQISTSLVLVGPQRMGKSRFFEHVVPPTFRSNGSSLKIGTSKENDAMRECLGGTLCVLNEIGQTFKRSEYESLKDFLSKPVDEYRLPYSRNPVVKPRCTVFVGTANELELADQTGSLRFMPLAVTEIDLDTLRRVDMQQVHAQAYHMVLHEKNEWWLSKEENEELQAYNDVWRSRSEEEMLITDHMREIDARYKKEWLSLTQIFKIIGVQYSSRRAQLMKYALKNAGIRHEDTVALRNKQSGNGKRLRNVFHFPITEDMKVNLL